MVISAQMHPAEYPSSLPPSPSKEAKSLSVEVLQPPSAACLSSSLEETSPSRTNRTSLSNKTPTTRSMEEMSSLLARLICSYKAPLASLSLREALLTVVAALSALFHHAGMWKEEMPRLNPYLITN